MTNDIMRYKPPWYAACNAVIQYSLNGYYCDGGYLSITTEKKYRDINRNRIITYINSLLGRQDVVSSKEISEKLGIIEDFVIKVMEEEFDLTDEHEQ